MAGIFKTADFVHPEDRAAREQLESIPVLPQAISSFMKLSSERREHAFSMASKLRISPRQLPRIYRMLPPICEAYGIAEPELYLAPGPVNAFTTGHKNPSITLFTGLLHDLDDEAVRAVIAHECGHIACEHVLYHSMAQMIIAVGTRGSGLLSFLSKPLQLALLAWSRKSELSADRASAAFMGSPDPMVRTLMCFAGVNQSLADQIDIDVFIEQAQEYIALRDTSRISHVMQLYRELQQSHPLVPLRLRELREWCASKQFDALRRVAADFQAVARCDRCAQPVGLDWLHCQACGGSLKETGVGP